MGLRLCGTTLVLGLLFLLPANACADALYSYSSTNTGLGVENSIAWTFEVPSILTISTGIPASSLLSSSLGGFWVTRGCSIDSVDIEPLNTNYFGATSGFVATNTICTLEPLGGFVEQSNPPTPFTSFGVYHIGQAGTLVISSTPEPSSLVLLGLALVSLGGIIVIGHFLRLIP